MLLKTKLERILSIDMNKAIHVLWYSKLTHYTAEAYSLGPYNQKSTGFISVLN